jgi:hypothetical protein
VCACGRGDTHALSWAGGRAILAELGTLQVEFVALAQRLNNASYAEPVLRIIDVLDRAHKNVPGLYPICALRSSLSLLHSDRILHRRTNVCVCVCVVDVGIHDGNFQSNSISLGAICLPFFPNCFAGGTAIGRH